MSQTEEIIEGTLQSDGTLALDHDPQLPPGRVRVIIQVSPSTVSRQRGLADVIAEIRSGQQARGFQGRTAEEMRAEEAVRADEDDEYDCRMQALGSQAPSAPPKGNP